MFLLMVLVLGSILLAIGFISDASQRKARQDRIDLGLRVDTNSLYDDPARRREIAERRWKK